MPFTVQITKFEDDYKHRYDSGVYPQSPKLFRHYENAKKFVCEEMTDHVIVYINEEWNKDPIQKQYFNIVDDCLEIKHEYKHDLDAIEVLIETYLKGAYVDYLVEYDISDTTFEDDDAVAASKFKSADNI
jgi:hypothetical protein